MSVFVTETIGIFQHYVSVEAGDCRTVAVGQEPGGFGRRLVLYSAETKGIYKDFIYTVSSPL